jgi:hypothetical protein
MDSHEALFPSGDLGIAAEHMDTLWYPNSLQAYSYTLQYLGVLVGRDHRMQQKL